MIERRRTSLSELYREVTGNSNRLNGNEQSRLFVKSGALAASDGFDGNYGLNTSTGDLFGPKVSGSWPGVAIGNVLLGGGGSILKTITDVAAGNYTVLSTDDIIQKNAITGGGDTITLPESPARGKMFMIKDASGGAGTDNLTIDTVGAPTIDGAASVIINTNYMGLQFYFDGTNYHTI